MSEVKLTIIGSGDAFGTRGKLNTCFLVEAGPELCLIDCGASSLPALKRAGVELNRVSTIFLSHFHGDHFGGLPFFLLDALLVQGRTEPLDIVGPLGLKERMLGLQEALFKGSSTLDYRFDIHYHEIKAHTPSPVGNYEVTYIPVVHSPESNPHGLKLRVGKSVVAYSGDTEWTENLIPLASGTDLFIVECYNFSGDQKFHLNHQRLLNNKALLETKRIMLTHLGGDMFAHEKEIEFDVCRDGQVIEI